VKRNVFFELNYSEALHDQNKRRSFISNAMIIIKMTKGKNIILSSDCDHWLNHRSPYDLIALYQRRDILSYRGATIGLTKDGALKAISENPSKALQRAIYRKAYKGTISQADDNDIRFFEEKK
jgi:ribonuclease P/MRP protein subunit RPP1